MSEKRSLMPGRLKMPIWKIRFSYKFIYFILFFFFFFAALGVAMVNVETADCHVSAGMTGEIQMAS